MLQQERAHECNHLHNSKGRQGVTTVRKISTNVANGNQAALRPCGLTVADALVPGHTQRAGSCTAVPAKEASSSRTTSIIAVPHIW